MQTNNQTSHTVDAKTAQNVLSVIGKSWPHYSDDMPDKFSITIEPYVADRSLAQNRLSHMHYQQIAKHTGETADYTKARIKLDHGIPILLAENEKFARRWYRATRGLRREQEINAASLVGVTSILTVKQMAAYITSYMQSHEEQGVILTHPDDLIYEAMGWTR